MSAHWGALIPVVPSHLLSDRCRYHAFEPLDTSSGGWEEESIHHGRTTSILIDAFPLLINGLFPLQPPLMRNKATTWKQAEAIPIPVCALNFRKTVDSCSKNYPSHEASSNLHRIFITAIFGGLLNYLCTYLRCTPHQFPRLPGPPEPLRVLPFPDTTALRLHGQHPASGSETLHPRRYSLYPSTRKTPGLLVATLLAIFERNLATGDPSSTLFVSDPPRPPDPNDDQVWRSSVREPKPELPQPPPPAPLFQLVHRAVKVVSSLGKLSWKTEG
ncbi:hypothetical protein QBC44DRAFT_13979 [Cladorrhinum sp. PSN332]|nr:hypothetical protein QBC44DRAFT_13979 [Cladorrhinum sp. PSN332]